MGRTNHPKLRKAVVRLMQNDEKAAEEWLNTPKELLDNMTPLEWVESGKGDRTIEDLIGRLEHGVFS